MCVRVCVCACCAAFCSWDCTHHGKPGTACLPAPASLRAAAFAPHPAKGPALQAHKIGERAVGGADDDVHGGHGVRKREVLEDGLVQQVEAHVQSVPQGDEGERDHLGRPLGAHHLGHRAVGDECGVAGRAMLRSHARCGYRGEGAAAWPWRKRRHEMQRPARAPLPCSALRKPICDTYGITDSRLKRIELLLLLRGPALGGPAQLLRLAPLGPDQGGTQATPADQRHLIAVVGRLRRQGFGTGTTGSRPPQPKNTPTKNPSDARFSCIACMCSPAQDGWPAAATCWRTR